jgi:adenosylhomocysteine nucleosidase
MWLFLAWLAIIPNLIKRLIKFCKARYFVWTIARKSGERDSCHNLCMTTAIISALPEEQIGLFKLLFNSEQTIHTQRAVKHGLIHQKPVILALSGVGKVAAAVTATMLIEKFQVQRIIFTGVAGAVASHVQVGDLVIGSEYLQHDMDASPIFPRHEIPYYGRSRFDGDSKLVGMLMDAARSCLASGEIPQSGHRLSIHQGLIISGDRFVSSAREVQALRSELPDALCVEMEGAAIAQVCHDYRIPFAAMRTISDKADDHAHIDFPKFVSEIAEPVAVNLIDRLLRAF